MKGILYFYTLIGLILPYTHQAQSTEIRLALNELQANAVAWGLTEDDCAHTIVSDYYTDDLNGIIHIYLQQTIDGIPIENAINGFYITPAQRVGSSRNRFYQDAKSLMHHSQSTIAARDAVIYGGRSIGIYDFSSLSRKTQTREDNVFTAVFSLEEIHVKKKYFNYAGKLRLVYEVPIDKTGDADYWNIWVDAENGNILGKENRTIYCQVDGRLAHNHTVANPIMPESEELNGAQYRVYALPADNPGDGPFITLTDPHNPAASPFGWHDTDGIAGPEYTITRGNNVHAYDDSEDNNSSPGNEPDGSPSLNFNFNHQLTLDPEVSKNAAITNLFYANNMAHDLAYILGFTESAGNFQVNNYGKGGKEEDYVRAEGFDGSGRNNANFSVTPDGSKGRMQMYLFDKVSSYLQVESPSELAEQEYTTGGADFGPALNQVEIEGEVALAITADIENPTTACSPITSDVNGKVALIDRGVCDFSKKVYEAQEAGAVMAIICNIAGVLGGTGEEIIHMGGEENAEMVEIPSAFMKKSDCDLIRISITNGNKVVVSAKDRPITGPDTYDSNFDNGIILHEYGHGISTRLTGGPSQAGCLPTYRNADGSNPRGEQMGEGWSDFFALIWTTKPGDQGDIPRGVGTYVSGEENTGRGIRSFPYCTDMSINPLTYDDIRTASVPHGVGTVWASILWDLYWDFIEIYGFKPDWTDTSSGNYKAAYLVMEAMKIQPCQPGFIDGRDAILDTDAMLYEGVHNKMIWEAFARRGVGYYAEQGKSNDHRDGHENFDIPPLLIEDLKIEKTGSSHAIPGEEMIFTITVKNHIPQTQHQVEVTDLLPEGLTYVEGSAEISPIVTENQMIFDFGTLQYQEEKSVTYHLLASDKIMSERLYYDDVEGSSGNWTVENREGSSTWVLSGTKPLSGSQSWYTEEVANEENSQVLTSPSLHVTGTLPVFRFWHRYEVFPAVNGGFVEISTDSGETWNKVSEQFIIRNKYPGELSFFAFAIPNLEGFSGSTGRKYIDSYIDLRPYIGEQIKIRFRFGTSGDNIADYETPGWYLDDFEIMDLVTYLTQACVESQEDSEKRCTESKEIVVNTSTSTAVVKPPSSYGIHIYPVPADKSIQINLLNSTVSITEVYLLSLSGQLLRSKNLDKLTKGLHLSVKDLTSGSYLLVLKSQDQLISQKVSIIH